MSVQWITDRSGQWVNKTSDGYYAIASEKRATAGGHHAVSHYAAFHIEALWATPSPIGGGTTLNEAQQICDAHRNAPIYRST